MKNHPWRDLIGLKCQCIDRNDDDWFGTIHVVYAVGYDANGESLIYHYFEEKPALHWKTTADGFQKYFLCTGDKVGLKPGELWPPKEIAPIV